MWYENGNGGAIFFYGESALFEQVFGVDCQCFYYSGQFISAKVAAAVYSDQVYLKMFQSTVLRCPGKENQRIFKKDYETIDSCYFDTYSNISDGPEDYMKIELGGCNITDNREFISNSAFRITDSLIMYLHHINFNNLEQIEDYTNGLLHIEDGYHTYIEDCNFISCTVDLTEGAFICCYDQADLDDNYTFGRIFVVNGIGKYFIFETYSNLFIHIVDSIYVYSFRFDQHNITWNNFLTIVTSPLTLNLDSSLTKPFNIDRIVKVYTGNYLPEFHDAPCFSGITQEFTPSPCTLR